MIGIMSKQQDEMLRSFGRRFQLLRQEKDLSQTAIAAMLEGYGVSITPSHLSLVEKNKRNVSVELLVALARLLETSTDYLLVLTDNPAPRDSTDVVPYISREADAAARLARIENVAAHGLAKLDGDATTGNAWLRRHVRMWVQDGRIVAVEWL